jgi:hypothetical protein
MSHVLTGKHMLTNFLSVVLKHPFLFIVIMAMPFSNSPLFSHNLAGITGMKPFNLFVVGLVSFWFFKGGNLTKFSTKGDIKAAMLFYLYIVIFMFEFGRSFLNYNVLAMRFPGDFPTSSFSFLLSYCVKGLLFTFSFLYILQLIKTPREIFGVLIMLVVSFLFFGLFSTLISYNVQTVGLLRNNLAAVFNDYFGMHYNSVATIIMLGAPIIFGLALELGKRYFFLLAITLLALVFAGSRGALGAAGLSLLFVMFFSTANSKSTGKLLILAFVTLSALVFLSSSIISFIIGSEAEVNFDQISNGRWELMWTPLLTELVNKRSALIFGYGFFGMVQSDAYIFARDFFQASHAHNAYINLLIDAGLIVLVPFLLIFYFLFKRALTVGRILNSPIYYGLLGSVVAYMVAAFSGRQFFPTLDNMMLFPIIALIVAYARATHKKEESHEYN